jgi:hypothetical protein
MAAARPPSAAGMAAADLKGDVTELGRQQGNLRRSLPVALVCKVHHSISAEWQQSADASAGGGTRKPHMRGSPGTRAGTRATC